MLRLWLASEAEKPALSLWYERYLDALLHDATPREADPYFDLYWSKPETRFPYLFGMDEPQGFAFVRVSDEPGVDYELAEFCVATHCRRSGLGTSVLSQIFERHPGRWELGVLLSNSVGLAFWPKSLRAMGVREVRIFESDTSRTYEFSAP